MRNQYKSGVFMSYLSIILSTILGFVITPFLIYYLGKDQYGMYSAIVSFSAYVGIMDLGLGSTVIRYIAQYRTTGQKEAEEGFLYFVRRIYWYITIASAVVCVALSIFVPNIFAASIPKGEENIARAIFLLAAGSICVTIMSNIYYSTIRAYERFFVARGYMILQDLIRTAIVVVMLLLGFGVIYVAAADLLSNIIGFILKWTYCKRNIKITIRKREINKAQIMQIFGFSFSVVLYSIASKIFWQVDKVLLGALVSAGSVAVYAVGAQFTTALNAISAAISSMYLPHAVKAIDKKLNGSEIAEIMARLARYQLFVIVPVIFGFGFFGRQVIQVQVGTGYDNAYTIALIVMCSMVPPLCYAYSDSVLKATNRQWFISLTTIASVVVNIILTVLLIPQYREVGAAVGSVIAYCLQTVGMGIYLQKSAHINMGLFIRQLTKRFLPTICIIVAVGVALNLYHSSSIVVLFIKVLVFSVAYLAAVYFLTMNENEKKIVSGMARKILHKGRKKAP